MVCGLLATTLQQVFYPTDNATMGLILAFATFAVGYIACPIGGLVIGRLWDTRDRMYALVVPAIRATGIGGRRASVS